MSEIKIKAEIDIIIDQESIDLYEKRGNTKIKDILEVGLLGSCSFEENIDCSNVIGNLLEANSAPEETIKKFLTGNSDEKCEIIQSLETKSIDYYLVYHFDKSPGSVESIGDNNDINGFIAITPFAPKSSSDKYGIKNTFKSIYCDACAETFRNKLSYNLANGGDNQLAALAPGNSLQVLNNWSQYGFASYNPLKDINEENLTATVTRTRQNAYGRTITERYKVFVLDKYFISKTEFGTVDIKAKYNGFNKWLYTKYYGGNSYDTITTRNKETRVGLSLGKIFTLKVEVATDPYAKRTRDTKRNVISITVTPSDSSVVMLGKDSAKQSLLLTKNTTGEKLPKNIDFRSFDTLINLYESGQIDFEKEESGQFKLYPDEEKMLGEAKIYCCDTYPESNFTINIKKRDYYASTNSGKLEDIKLSIDRVQKAQGGIYNTQITIPKNPCCEKCNYCVFGNLCDDLQEILQAIRDEEIQMRDHLAFPYTLKGSYQDVSPRLRSAKNPGPQCVAYDYGSGWPVPKKDIKGY